MEADALGNFNAINATTTQTFNPTFWFYIRETVKIIISTAAITCNFLIIFATIKLEKLREARFVYLANWGFVNASCLLISPFVVFLVDSCEVEFENFQCLLLQLESAFIVINLNVAFLMTLDWILANFLHYSFYRDKLIFIKIALYVFQILYVCYCCLYCLSNWRSIHHGSVVGWLQFLTSFLLVLHVLCYVYSRVGRRQDLLLRLDFAITLPTVYVLCWLPYLLVHLEVRNLDNCDYGDLWNFLAFVTECLIYSNAVINVVLLSRSESDFKETFLDTIRCKNGKYSEASNFQ